MKWESVKEAFEAGVRESLNIFKSGDCSFENLASAAERVSEDVRQAEKESSSDSDE